jgi:hypothetical protein
MKNTDHLLSLAHKLSNKYAEPQTLKEIIDAAASHGENSVNGIMNFPAQLKQDDAELNISITISSGVMGGKTVTVGDPRVYPSNLAPNYANLPKQIKKYLDRNIQYFPQIPDGTTDLRYPKAVGEGIATN